MHKVNHKRTLLTTVAVLIIAAVGLLRYRLDDKPLLKSAPPEIKRCVLALAFEQRIGVANGRYEFGDSSNKLYLVDTKRDSLPVLIEVLKTSSEPVTLANVAYCLSKMDDCSGSIAAALALRRINILSSVPRFSRFVASILPSGESRNGDFVMGLNSAGFELTRYLNLCVTNNDTVPTLRTTERAN